MAVGDILGIIKNRAINKVINGGIDFWQRGTSFLSMVAGTFTSDRFAYYQSGAYGVRCDRSTDVPTWSKSNYSMKFECTTAIASPSGSDFSQFNHTIEGIFFSDLIGTDIKIGFNFKASKVGTYVVVFRNGNLTRSFATTFNVSSINTWERYYVNVPSDTDLTGYTKDNTRSFIITFCFSNNTDGTHPNSLSGLNAWESVSNGFVSDSQTNLWDTIGATAFVSDIALFDAKHGNVEFSRAGNTYSEELSLCQRYHSKSYNIDQKPLAGIAGGRIWFDSARSSGSYASHSFSVIMRLPPVVQIISPDTGSSGFVSNASAGGDSAITMGEVGESDFNFYVNSPGLGSTLNYHWIADAEL